jgi:3-deoxy-manno-octulosonate cytidylyltransferase (CMP-KDO synthetase)
MSSTRLPGKPLADIHGEPMIVHVWRRAMEAGVGPVVVAADAPEIVAAIEKAGGKAVLTRPDHPSGSDRIFEAIRLFDPAGRHDIIVNVQGDLPTIEPEAVRAALEPLVGTAVAPRRQRALYFTRATAPWGDGPLFHHIGLYAYRRAALERFVTLPPSPLELRERLEQLRALEAGMRIDAMVVDAVPLGVDTPHDLDRARQLLK